MNNLKKIAAVLGAAVVMMTAAVSCGSSSSSSSSEATTASTEASTEETTEASSEATTEETTEAETETETEAETEAETEEAPAAADLATVLNGTVWVGEEEGVPTAMAFEGNQMMAWTFVDGQPVQTVCEWTSDAETITVALPDGSSSVEKYQIADDLSTFVTTDDEGVTVQYERFTGDPQTIGAELALRAAGGAAAPEEEIAE